MSLTSFFDLLQFAPDRMKSTNTTKRGRRKFLRVYLPGSIALELGWALNELTMDYRGMKSLCPSVDSGRNSKTVRAAIEALSPLRRHSASPSESLFNPGTGFKTTLSLYDSHLSIVRDSARRMGTSLSGVIATALVLQHRSLR